MAVRYQHIADDLRRRITSGAWIPGERLPAESALAALHKVSTPTLRNALDVLAGEGLLEKRHGVGNFVRHPFQRITYTNDRRAPDRRPLDDAELQVNVSASPREARGDLMSLLQVVAGTPLTEYVYLSHLGDAPYSLARVYVPRHVAYFSMPDQGRSPWGDDIEDRLAAAGVRTVATVERVTARRPTSEEADTLRLNARTAVLAVERTSTDAKGRVLAAALLVLPGDRAEAVFTTQAFDAEQEGVR